jgi:hypothetical protein
MREYQRRRGEDLEDRVEDMEAFITDYFGAPTTTTDYRDQTLHVVEEPDNPVFERVVVGTVEYSGKKDKVALDIEERPAEEVIAEGHVEAAEEAVGLKNEFLEAATGRDAKARRDSMKRDVEDDAEVPDNV